MAASSRPFRLGIRNAYGRPLYHWARTWARTFAVEAEMGSPADVAEFAAMEPHPRSVQYLISTVDPEQIWNFLRTEMPIRYAERIRSIEHVPHWTSVQDLVQVHESQVKSFEAFRRSDIHSSAQVAHEAVLEMCIECTGCSPTIQVEAFSSCGGGLDDDETPKFPYMPHVLKYIVMELLKNSCRATADMLHTHPRMRAEDCPINVIVCADEDHVTICVADRARGIPRGVNAWSYLYSTAKPGAYGSERRLAGHGVGLPLSRLYARYLGGALDLVSLPGYGTHAYVNLPRVQSQQVEVVPDRDYSYDHASILDFTV